jgi:hypothetical protein
MLRPKLSGRPKVFMSSDTLIREVDEELRRDRMRKLWRQTGPFVIGAAVLVVLVVAGYEGWNWWSKNQSSSSSDAFYAAAEIANGTDYEAAKKALDGVIATGSGAYPALAEFREASLLAQQGKTDDAVAAYDALATAQSNIHLRELALILGANLLIDKGDVAAVEQRVSGTIDAASPLRNAAREILGLTQYKAGKLDDAVKTFTDIVDDPMSGQDLRGRVQLYVTQLLGEGAKPVAPPAEAVAAPSEPAAPAASAEPSAAAPSAESSAEAAPAVSAPETSTASSEEAPTSSAP